MSSKLSKSYFWRLSHVPIFIWMFLFSGAVILITISNSKYLRVERMLPQVQEIKNEDTQKGYLIKTKGCKIPELPVFTKSLEEYFQFKFDGAHCNKDRPPLVESNLTSLIIVKSSFKIYNISDKSLLHCCYKELKRKIPNGQSDNQYEFGTTCFDFEESIDVEQEFVHVKCDYNEERLYEDLFAFIPLKGNNSFDGTQEKIKVLVIGVDGVSRINFQRQMPKSVEYLKKIEFQEFLGYNKIGDNTYPNLIAVLTGNDEDTIQNTCRKSNKYYDNCTFLWNHFKDSNYVTSFAEDSAWMGLFNYQRYGFQKQPTDYIWGFFERIGESLLGNSKSMNVMQCIGPREGYRMLVKYIYDFVYRMKSWRLPYFAFFWSASLSHDDVNKPRIGDEVYLNLFKDMFNKGFFENTVVVVMSDHGMRFGSFRQTYQGRIEERLPFLYIRLPQTFREKYSLATNNLRINSRRLTTPFDLHETLYDLTVPDHLKNEFIEHGKRASKSQHGLSLFHQITPTRTCEDAGIADHWCACLESTPIEITPEVTNTANFTISYLNTLLKGYAQCSVLQLKEISNAQVLSHSKETLGSNVDFKDTLISFQTKPGDGLFEATVRTFHDGKMELVGTVSRLNLYGKQSVCITDFHLKLYCYCKKNVWG